MNIKNVFDKIVVLNLERRTDRLKLVRESMRTINLHEDEYSVHHACDALALAASETKDLKIKKGAHACNKSYLKIFTEFMHTDLNTLVVVEDDCAFLKDFDYTIFETIPENWDLLYFGANNNIQPKVFNKNWNKIIKSYSSHMIAYSRKAIAFILNYLQKEEFIKEFEYDVILHRFVQCQDCYISKTLYAYQNNSYSDIEMKNVDYSWMLK